jgi:uncharacterized protein (TIGR02996 family)
MIPLPPPLLAQILETPSDDAPRIEAADWLMENGEPERGEFVAVQLRLARGGDCRCDYPYATGCGVCRLRRRERELLRTEVPDEGGGTCPARYVWAQPVSRIVGIGGNWECRRGFVEAVTLAAADLPRLDEMLSVQPVEEVRLTTWPEIEYSGPANRARFRGRTKLHDVPPGGGEIASPLLRLEWPRIRQWHLPEAAP